LNKKQGKERKNLNQEFSKESFKASFKIYWPLATKKIEGEDNKTVSLINRHRAIQVKHKTFCHPHFLKTNICHLFLSSFGLFILK